MSIFTAEHRRLVQMLHPTKHQEYSDVLSSLGSFMDEEILPISPKLDSGEEPIGGPRNALFAQGMSLVSFPAEYGGLGLPFSVYAMAVELLGTADASVALSVEIHNAVAEGVLRFGSESQRERYLGPMISGRKLASFALTEPASGSDAGNMATTAEKHAGEYVINGSKMFITNAGEADVYLVFAKTSKGPSCFLLESPNPGLKFGAELKKLGMRGSKTREVIFSDCRVPEENLVGVEGEGADYAKEVLHGARIVVAALNVGIAQLAYGKALAYARQRRAFGRAIADFQLIREKVADTKIGINAGRLLYLYASRIKESGGDYSSEASQAKVYATEMSLKACDDAIQIHGGYGYTTDDLHRHWRDARLLTIGEGTSEVLRMLISRRELARAA
ncbi:MAG: acyl-CoA dehydrogenase family protein [Nitrososphaerota archaeon]|nr:acyl-CoA dehydrogenase family protein [Nitrososphaerota archaeon]MDG7025658.1 acyl-CoA dehydrogenase family protein [Nitrososphaerota archaeon]